MALVTLMYCFGVPCFLKYIFIFFKDLFIHERHTEREREREREAETQPEGEAESMLEPDVGFDPRSPGSHPGLKVAVNH